MLVVVIFVIHAYKTKNTSECELLTKYAYNLIPMLSKGILNIICMFILINMMNEDKKFWGYMRESKSIQHYSQRWNND